MVRARIERSPNHRTLLQGMNFPGLRRRAPQSCRRPIKFDKRSAFGLKIRRSAHPTLFTVNVPFAKLALLSLATPTEPMSPSDHPEGRAVTVKEALFAALPFTVTVNGSGRSSRGHVSNDDGVTPARNCCTGSIEFQCACSLSPSKPGPR